MQIERTHYDSNEKLSFRNSDGCVSVFICKCCVDKNISFANILRQSVHTGIHIDLSYETIVQKKKKTIANPAHPQCVAEGDTMYGTSRSAYTSPQH